MISTAGGTAAELLIAAQLVRHGHIVAMPILPNQPGWDLLVEAPQGGWTKVQIKNAYARPGRAGLYVDSMKWSPGGTARRRYTEEDFDVLVAVDLVSGEWWWIPFAELKGRRITVLYPGDPWHMKTAAGTAPSASTDGVTCAASTA